MPAYSDDAGLGEFGVAKKAGFVNGFAGEAEVGRGSSVPNGNGGISAARPPHDIAPLLRRVVLIGEAALGMGFDVEEIGLGAAHTVGFFRPGDDRVMTGAKGEPRGLRD